MKTLLSIGVMTVLSGAGAAAWAQAPTPQAQQRPQAQPGAAPSSGSAAATTAPSSSPARVSANQLVELQTMDANDDDLVSRQEYMAHYERMYSSIRKDSAGMISLKDLTASTTASQPTR